MPTKLRKRSWTKETHHVTTGHCVICTSGLGTHCANHFRKEEELNHTVRKDVCWSSWSESFMLIENRIKRKIEYEKTDREDKDESRLKEREIRSFQSKGKQFCQLRNQQGEAKQSKKEKPFCCEENNYPCFIWNSSNSSKNEREPHWSWDQCKARKFKRTRAYGECLGIRSRWRTWQAAISRGELQISFDPRISEWGNSHGEEPWNVNWIHRLTWGTPRSETSK